LSCSAQHAVAAGVLHMRTGGPALDAAALVAGVAAAAADHQLRLGLDPDLVGPDGDLVLGQQVDAGLQRLDVDVGLGRNDLDGRASVVMSKPSCARSTPCPSVRSSNPSPRTSLRPALSSTRVMWPRLRLELWWSLLSCAWIGRRCRPSAGGWSGPPRCCRRPCQLPASKALNALWPGNSHGGRFTWLCTRPVQIGRSGSPEMKSTMTSWPMRGRWTPPSWLPAHGELTRSQQLLCWFFWPMRSQGNWTLMRPARRSRCSLPRARPPARPARPCARLGLGECGAQGFGDGVGREVHLGPPLLLALARFLGLAVLGHVLDQEAGVEQQVLGVGGFSRMLLQLEGAPGHHASQVAAGLGPGAVGAQGLHAQHGQQVAFGPRIVAGSPARVGLNVVAAGIGPRAIGRPRHRHALWAGGPCACGVRSALRPGVVVVPWSYLPLVSWCGHEAVDVFGIDLPARRVVLDLSVGRAVGHGLIRAHVVREHQAVLALRVRSGS
jgi:hypothetical protein